MSKVWRDNCPNCGELVKIRLLCEHCKLCETCCEVVGGHCEIYVESLRQKLEQVEKERDKTQLQLDQSIILCRGSIDRGIELQKDKAELLDVGTALAKAQGHKLNCGFSSCTCGAVQESKEALTAFWRVKQALAKHGNPKKDDGEGGVR